MVQRPCPHVLEVKKKLPAIIILFRDKQLRPSNGVQFITHQRRAILRPLHVPLRIDTTRG